MPNIQQWPSHQQKMYRHVTEENQRREQQLTGDQKDHLKSLWQTEAEKYAELLKTTDYPDALADVVSRQHALNIVLKQSE